MLVFPETRLFIHSRKTSWYYSTLVDPVWNNRGFLALSHSDLLRAVASCPAAQRKWNLGTPEKRTAGSVSANSPAALLLLLGRVRGQWVSGETCPKAVTTSPHMLLCRRNLQHSNANQSQNRISNTRHQDLGCWAFFHLMCNDLPFLNVKLCSSAKPSNQWLYLVSPIVCIPGPFRRSVPCSQAGNWPTNRKEISVSIHLGEGHNTGQSSLGHRLHIGRQTMAVSQDL